MKKITALGLVSSEIEESNFYAVTLRCADGQERTIRMPSEVAQAVGAHLLARTGGEGHRVPPPLIARQFQLAGQSDAAFEVELAITPARQLRVVFLRDHAVLWAKKILGLPATPDVDLTKTPKH